MAKTKRGVSPILGIVVLLLLAALGVGGSYIYTNKARQAFLEEEKSLPESAISTYLQHIRNKDFDGIYEDSLVIAPHINSKEDYINKLQEIYQDVDIDRIVFAPVESDDKNLKYVLAYDNKYLSTLELMKSKENVVFLRGSGKDSSLIHKTETVNGIKMLPQYVWIKGSAVVEELNNTEEI